MHVFVQNFDSLACCNAVSPPKSQAFTFAPFWIRNSATLSFPFSAADLTKFHSRKKMCLHNVETINLIAIFKFKIQYCHEPICNAVHPKLSTELTFEPLFTSRSTTFTFPFAAAMCNAVCSSLSTRFMFAPLLIKLRTNCSLPVWHSRNSYQYTLFDRNVWILCIDNLPVAAATSSCKKSSL